MKKLFTLLVTVLLSQLALAQQSESVITLQHALKGPAQVLSQPVPPIRCYTVEMDSLLHLSHPEIGTKDDFESWMSREIPRLPSSRAVVTIPVIVHVINNGEAVGSGTNISAAQVQSQIDVLNEDFRRLNADKVNTPAAFVPVAADIEIEFCLALQDPAGNILAEPGIHRVTVAGGPFSTNYVDNTIKPATSWDPTRYMNIWTANVSGGVLGWAQFPEAAGLAGIGTGNGAANTDGVVILYNAFGRVGNLDPTYNLGRTATHEVGHWLGLRHIWGDGGCGVDDFCNDTPPSGASNFNCPTTIATCGPVQMVQNYMDYTDDYCMNIFTADQKARMQVVITSSVRRLSLTTSTVCSLPNPQISFAVTTLAGDEAATTGTNCDRYKDLSLSLSIGVAPVGAAQVQVNVSGGTATLGADFSFPNGNTVTFPNGSSANQTLTLRLLDDAEIESLENATFSLTLLNPGSTDAVLSAFNQTATLTITDNEIDPAIGTQQTLFSENFEGTLSGWATGSFINPAGSNAWIVNGTGALSGSFSAHISSNGNSLSYNASSTSNTLLRSPLLNASQFQAMSLSFLYRCNGEVTSGVYYDYGTVYYSLDGLNFITLKDSIAQITTAQTLTISLPASLNGQSFYLGFGWRNDNSIRNNPPFVIDNIVVSGSTLIVSNQLNASQFQRFGPGSTVHFFDQTTKELMVSLHNIGTYDYGCTQVIIDRAGTGVTQFWDNTSPANQFHLANKTFKVIPENNTPGNNGDYEITLYYRSDEFSGWQTGTGSLNTNADVKIVKSPGAISHVTPLNLTPDGPIAIQNATLGAIGTNVTVKAIFGTGFSGFGVGNPGSGTLPIEFLYFNAAMEGSDAALDWGFASDFNIAGFSVERSSDARNFEVVTRMPFSDLNGSLTFVDKKAGELGLPVIYYRIKGTDINGADFYSEIRALSPEMPAFSASVVPNPSVGAFYVQALLSDKGEVRAEVWNITGKVLLQQVWEGDPGAQRWEWKEAESLPAGVYLVRVAFQNHETWIRAIRQ